MINKVFEEIIQSIANKKHIVIAIDGMAASGKSTFAQILKNRFDARIIHADDFFLPIEKRTNERVNTPGGNIDYEKMKKEVIDKINQDIKYFKYDCNTNSFHELVDIKKTQITVVEGSYSLHPYFGKYYDFSVFMEIDSQLQMKRILNRNGETLLNKFLNEWIPMENEYFKNFKIKENASYIIEIR